MQGVQANVLKENLFSGLILRSLQYLFVHLQCISMGNAQGNKSAPSQNKPGTEAQSKQEEKQPNVGEEIKSTDAPANAEMVQSFSQEDSNEVIKQVEEPEPSKEPPEKKDLSIKEGEKKDSSDSDEEKEEEKKEDFLPKNEVNKEEADTKEELNSDHQEQLQDSEQKLGEPKPEQKVSSSIDKSVDRSSTSSTNPKEPKTPEPVKKSELTQKRSWWSSFRKSEKNISSSPSSSPVVKSDKLILRMRFNSVEEKFLEIEVDPNSSIQSILEKIDSHKKLLPPNFKPNGLSIEGQR